MLSILLNKFVKDKYRKDYANFDSRMQYIKKVIQWISNPNLGIDTKESISETIITVIQKAQGKKIDFSSFEIWINSVNF